MRCPDCAADIPDDSQFCPSCGKSIPAGVAPPPPPPEPAEEEGPFKPKGKPPAEAPGEAPEEKPGPRGGTHGDKAFCDHCQGVFPPGELEKFEGKKLCSGCRKRLESRKPSGRNKAAPPPDRAGAPEPGAPPREGKPEGEGKPSSSKLPQIREPVSGSRVAAFVAGGVFIVLILGVGVAFFLLSDDPGASKPQGPGAGAAALPAKKEEPAPKTEPAKKEEVKKADPVVPAKPRTYESRWFSGTYLGILEGEDPNAGAMVFESDSREKVMIAAPREVADHCVKGRRYKFKFTETDEFYNKGSLNIFDLEATIQEDK